MNELHLFAGAGGGVLGGMLRGNTCVCAVEIDGFCRTTLLRRQRDGIFPQFPIWDDIRTFDANPWRGRVGRVCGGFPCQDISISGTGGGIEGKRSVLWAEMARVVREVRPSEVLVENSPALTFRGLGRVLGDLAAMGFDAEWGVLSAADAIWACGTPALDHLRERIWVLARSNPDSQRRRSGSPWIRYAGHARKSPGGERGLHWWNPEPRVGRVAHGVAHRVDRLRAIGNGQLPVVAAFAEAVL